MNVSTAIDKIVGKRRTVMIGDEEVIAYPLTYEEYLTAMQMAPKSAYTIEELKEHVKTGEPLPLKSHSKEYAIGIIKQEMYVISRTLLKNDPTFDIKILEKDMAVFFLFEPLFKDVWESSNPDPEVVKKKVLA